MMRRFSVWCCQQFTWLLVVAITLAILGGSRESRGKEAATAKGSADAKTAGEMQPYQEPIPGTGVVFAMVPVPGGKFMMGSPESEEGRGADEGPQHEVEVAPFWMGKYEVTWDEFELWYQSLEIARRGETPAEASARNAGADAITRPTGTFTDLTFGMGRQGFPAECMTQFCAFTYTKWLSERTGHYYRLPTEAEWEYACRAGSKSRYCFGDDEAQLAEYGWFEDSSETSSFPEGAFHKIGLLKPNAWGLYDMHGNVAEWTLDFYHADAYGARAGKLSQSPLVQGTTEYPRVARGGAYSSSAAQVRSAARLSSERSWKKQDPQFPQSRWWMTDAQFVGMRVVRPLVEPSAEEKARLWNANVDVAPKGGKEQ